MAREPGYRLHKPTGQAYVRLGGKMFYLGSHGSEESRQKYARLKAEWLASRHAEKFISSASGGPTIAQLCLGYLDFAEGYYGKDSKEVANIKLAVRPLSELYATLPARSFGPLEFRTVRETWLEKESPRHPGRLSRQYINSVMKKVTRIIKWAVGEGLIPPAVHQAITCVAPLKRGRTAAPEAEPIKPVAPEVVDATLEHLPRITADMVRLQLLLGCRPGEVCALTPAMVDRSGEVWTITVAEHKGAWRGRARTIYAGPKAQEILSRYLLRPADSPCFSPQEAMARRRAERHAARTTPLSCGNRPGTNRKRRPRKEPGEAYTTASYGKAIQAACDRAFPPPGELARRPNESSAARDRRLTEEQRTELKKWQTAHRWAPNQLRHATGTAVRKRFGLEAAQLILGHAAADVTQVYAERDAEKAREIARLIG